jgi:hypothetical protein
MRIPEVRRLPGRGAATHHITGRGQGSIDPRRTMSRQRVAPTRCVGRGSLNEPGADPRWLDVHQGTRSTTRAVMSRVPAAAHSRATSTFVAAMRGRTVAT